MTAFEIIGSGIGLLVGIGGSWFFAGTETGLYTTNRLRLRYRAERGEGRARLLARLLASPRQMICTTLVGNNLSVYISTAFCSLLIAHLFGLGKSAATEFLTVLLLTPVLLLFGEIYPKNIFHARADRLMYFFARPLHALRLVFLPITSLLMGLVHVLERVVGLADDSRSVPFTLESLRHFLQLSARAGALSAEQKAMADNIVRLRKRTVAYAMVPITEAAVVPRGVGEQSLREALAERRYARVPVYSETRQNVVGVLNLFDIEDWTAQDLSIYMRPPVYLPSGTPIDDGISFLRRNRTALAIVIDNHGRTMGIVTVKDLIGEIVGGL